MLVRMTVGLVGPALTLEPGQEHDFPDAQAIRLIEAGSAVPVLVRETERAVVERTQERRRKGKAR